jgi:AraC-like DNA-binding protein
VADSASAADSVVGGEPTVAGSSAAGAMGRGVLRPDLAAGRFGLIRSAPSGPLARFVDYYWIVRWDLRGQPPYEQTILPHPNVNLVFEASGAGIYGVDRSLFARRLCGQGKALGVRFRAGCFRPFWGAPVSQLSDRVIPATRVFGPLAEKTRQAIMLAETDDDMTSHAESLLFSALPEPDPVAEQTASLVALITSDSSLRRVDQLASACGLSVRGLQRMFADYVGVSPKWVMRRARLHDAALRADGGEPVDWATLALDLGYADQAHLTRDFTATIGVPPARYFAGPLLCWALTLLGPYAAGLLAGGTVRRFRRRRPLSSACRISAMTSAGWLRICLGVKGRTMMPYLPIRR